MTPQQSKVLDYVTVYYAEHGYGPRYTDIAFCHWRRVEKHG